MPHFLKKWLSIHDEETAVFGWTVLLLLLLSAATVILNNYAETAFLKRFGVKHLPVIYMLNSILTFILMGLLGGVLARLPGVRLLTYVLFFFAGSIAAFRFIIPLEIDLLYPVLYILKAQYVILVGLLFWNLANDLFNTRQAKRLFPLIAAGGAIGTVLGSAVTPVLAGLFSMDNLTLAYGALMVLAALVVAKMGARFPTLVIARDKPVKSESKPTILNQFQDVRKLMKKSDLVWILILLTLIPNVIIPVLNYQFNFAIDSQFGTEDGLVSFFGYFRSFMSLVSLLLLLFVSKAYSRWGLAAALMFHPLNYALVFIAFLAQFNVFSAIYARLSTTVIRTTLNKPVTDILMGVFPVSYRAALRPFLRGTIVRIGLFAGSGIILAAGHFFHPQYLSLAMLPFVIAWFLTTLYLKRHYARILADLMAENVLDLKALEIEVAKRLFKGRESQKRLLDSFLAERSPGALWYAQVLRSLDVPDLDEAILAVIGNHDNRTRIRLLDLLSNRAGGKAVTVLSKYARGDDRAIAAAALQTVRRLGTPSGTALCQSILETTVHPEIKALAAAGCLGSKSAEYRKQVDIWLDSGDPDLLLAGVIGAGESGQAAYLKVLDSILDPGTEPTLLAKALKSYGQLENGLEGNMAAPYLQHSHQTVRWAAIEALRIDGDRALQEVVALLGDPENHTRRIAEEKILSAPYQNGPLLIEALNVPGKKGRDILFRILSTLDIKALDTFSYAKTQIEICYRRLAEAQALRQVQADRYAALLADHLEEQGHSRLEDLLRVVALQDRSGTMRTIFRNLFSNDPRKQANAREALEDVANRALLKLFMPLVKDLPRHRVVALGRKRFKLPDYAKNLAALYTDLFQSGNWITVVMALPAAANCRPAVLPHETTTSLAAAENPHIRQAVDRHCNPDSSGRSVKETDMEMEMPIPDKILHLKNVDIFKNMSVNELAAIASITEQVVYPAGNIMFQEGDPAESMYMVITGEITAFKDETDPPEVFKPGDSIGGIVLLTDDVRLFSARTSQETSLLMIHKRDFLEIVREYPQIALDISKLLCEYVKELWQRASDRSNTDGNSIFNGPVGIDRSDQ